MTDQPHDKGVSDAARRLGKDRKQVRRYLDSGAMRSLADSPATVTPTVIAREIGTTPGEVVRLYSKRGRVVRCRDVEAIRFTAKAAAAIIEDAQGFTWTLDEILDETRVPVRYVRRLFRNWDSCVMSRDMGYGRQPHFNINAMGANTMHIVRRILKRWHYANAAKEDQRRYVEWKLRGYGARTGATKLSDGRTSFARFARELERERDKGGTS